MTAQAGNAPLGGGDLEALVRDGALQGHWTLDPQASRVEFGVKHFWGAITVRGWFAKMEGEANVEPHGKVSGQIVMDAASLDTKNKQRDKHLRSADFFHADQHPEFVLRVDRLEHAHGTQLTGQGTLAAAGKSEPITFTADVIAAGKNDITLRSELTFDRSKLGMTWSPMRVSAMESTGTVTARFVKEA